MPAKLTIEKVSKAISDVKKVRNHNDTSIHHIIHELTKLPFSKSFSKRIIEEFENERTYKMRVVFTKYPGVGSTQISIIRYNDDVFINYVCYEFNLEDDDEDDFDQYKKDVVTGLKALREFLRTKNLDLLE